MTVTPDQGLADGQTVAVRGSGFTPGATVSMVECRADVQDASGCDVPLSEHTTAGSDGTVSATYTVTRVIAVGGGSVDCATSGACVLGVGNLADQQQGQIVSLRFAGAP